MRSRRIFRDFTLLPVDMPERPDWIRIYDFSRRTIYENTARSETACILGFLPKTF